MNINNENKYGREKLEFYFKNLDDLINSDLCKSSGGMISKLENHLKEFLEERGNVDFPECRSGTYAILKEDWKIQHDGVAGISEADMQRFETHFEELINEEIEASKNSFWYQVWNKYLPGEFIWEKGESWKNLPVEISRDVFFAFHDANYG